MLLIISMNLNIKLQGKNKVFHNLANDINAIKIY